MKRVAVFCGSSSGNVEAFVASANALGSAMVKRGLGLVYGGGNVGLMGVIADRVMKDGGEVIGVIPAALEERELAHRGVTELRVVGSMHERKATMERLADGFIAMPGGFGTLEEIAEMLTWVQLGLHRKPCAFLDVDGFYAPLFAFFDRAVKDGLLRDEHRGVALADRDPEALLDAMERFVPIALPKWIDRDRS
jgi:hypothetical protein